MPGYNPFFWDKTKREKEITRNTVVGGTVLGAIGGGSLVRIIEGSPSNYAPSNKHLFFRKVGVWGAGSGIVVGLGVAGMNYIASKDPDFALIAAAALLGGPPGMCLAMTMVASKKKPKR